MNVLQHTHTQNNQLFVCVVWCYSPLTYHTRSANNCRIREVVNICNLFQEVQFWKGQRKGLRGNWLTQLHLENSCSNGSSGWVDG